VVGNRGKDSLEHQNCNNFVSFIEPLKPVDNYLFWIFFK
jgi:hypothetical protein